MKASVNNIAILKFLEMWWFYPFELGKFGRKEGDLENFTYYRINDIITYMFV